MKRPWAEQGALLAVLCVAATSQAGSEKESLLPKIDGWKISDGPTGYTPETLFEYIDGGADAFLQFDFEDLTAATYTRDDLRRGKNRPGHDATAPTKAEISVDIYRHKNAVRAFGMYTQERAAGTTSLPIGIEGHAGADHLQFVVGRLYVKLVQMGPKDPPLLRQFAEKLAASLPGTREAPAVLKAFPERGKRVRAEKFAARDFLGQSFLHDAVAVPYEVEGASFRLFVVEGKDSADVSTMVKRYRAIGKSDGGANSEGAATVKDPLNGGVALRWKGRWLWGAVDHPCPERQSLLDELGQRVAALER